MTQNEGLHAVRGGVATLRPHKSGQPWTDEDYEQMVASVRDGNDVDIVAQTLQRPVTSIGPRLRRLLPVEERRCPGDRVLAAAHRHLSDPAYDWASIMLLSEPPRPIQQPPDVVNRGVAGLSNTELVSCAYALLCLHHDVDPDLLARLSREVHARRLEDRVAARRVEHLLHRSTESAVTRLDADEVAWRWMHDAPGWGSARWDHDSDNARLNYLNSFDSDGPRW